MNEETNNLLEVGAEEQVIAPVDPATEGICIGCE